MHLTEEVRNFLENALIARIAVIDSDGYPHTVPIWFVRDGDDVIFFSSRSARKIKLAQANPKGSMSVGGSPYGAEGYLIKGDFSLEENKDNHWVRQIYYRYEPRELADQHLAESVEWDLVLMRLKPRKVIRI